MKTIGQILAIMRKDLISESRTRDVAVSVLVFAILVLVVFSISFESGAELTAIFTKLFTPEQFDSFTTLVAPGILWIAIVFAGVLSFNWSFAQEKEKGCLDALKLCPIDKEVIYIGKMPGSLVFLLIIEIILFLVFFVFFVLFEISLFKPYI